MSERKGMWVRVVKTTTTTATTITNLVVDGGVNFEGREADYRSQEGKRNLKPLTGTLGRGVGRSAGTTFSDFAYKFRHHPSSAAMGEKACSLVIHHCIIGLLMLGIHNEKRVIYLVVLRCVSHLQCYHSVIRQNPPIGEAVKDTKWMTLTKVQTDTSENDI